MTPPVISSCPRSVALPPLAFRSRKRAHAAHTTIATRLQALRSTASAWVESQSIPWGVLRGLCAALNESCQAKDGGPWVHELCQGGGVQLPAPPARAKTMTPELRQHLERLRRKLEQDSYDAMVRDVTQHVGSGGRALGFQGWGWWAGWVSGRALPRAQQG